MYQREYRYGFHSGRQETIFHVALLTAILVMAVVGFGIGMIADRAVAVRTLEAQGYSDIKITHHAWFLVGFRGCDRNDAARFTARARNPAGRPAEVYVCTGVLKGGTIRVK